MDAPASPPVPRHEPIERERWGDTVVDEYAWMREVEDPDTLPHLRAENAWTDAVTAHLAPLRDRLFEEIKSRVLETDLSVPWRKGAWWYYSRTEEGRSYPTHCRRPDDGRSTGSPDKVPAAGDADTTEQVLLDENALAEGHDYLSVGVLDVSPDGTRMAYAVDHAGDERHELRFRDLTTGDDDAEAIPDTSYGFAWAADSRTCWYTVVDDSERPWMVRRHEIGTDPATDVEVYREDDERFHVSVGASRSGDLAVIHAGSAITSESHLLDAHHPGAEAVVVAPREQGVEYSVAHHPEGLYVLSNHRGAENFVLWRAPLDGQQTGALDDWSVVTAHRDDTRLDAVETFADHVVVHLRHAGLTGIRILDPRTGDTHDLVTPEPVFTIGAGMNAEFSTSRYRFGYQSLVTPPSVFEEDLATGQRTLLKQQPVLGDYDPAAYTSAREWATADDGTRVPISIVWRTDSVPDAGAEPAPCLLYGYGAYEISMDPWFSAARLSLLDRGVVFAIAHVRGGGELGRRWYEDGKFGHKMNSFTDFVASARHLIETGRTAADRLAARGGSAGGLLMGAVANLAPEVFRAIVAEVPFVDPLNTILDPTLPLTVIEWEEWGNPVADGDAYRWLKAYSPYENVVARAYPSILATAGLNDPRVSFHEPAKWVARLRDVATSAGDAHRPILLKVELGAGHGGPSGRYGSWRQEAFVLAFVLDAIGVADRADH